MTIPDASNPFAGTIAEMTWSDVEAAAHRGAIVLWAVGVIEQHGPHLPAGTDVYVPMSTLLGVRERLEARGIESLILPPFYWGVNHVSSAFPASYGLSPALMEETVREILMSVSRDGFKGIFALSGHGDALHNTSLHKGIERARHDFHDCDFRHVLDAGLATRLGIPLDDAALLVIPPLHDPPAQISKFVDVHAGEWESSRMFVATPGQVRDTYAVLPDTRLDHEDLAEWRNGGERARRVTPEGYFGDPASATADRGRQWWEAQVAATAEAIAATVR